MLDEKDQEKSVMEEEGIKLKYDKLIGADPEGDTSNEDTTDNEEEEVSAFKKKVRAKLPAPQGSTIASKRVRIVRNTRENTSILYPDESLANLDPTQKSFVLAGLVVKKDRVNGKYFTVTKEAATYLKWVNKRHPGFTDSKVTDNNIFYADLRNVEYADVPPPYRIDIVKQEDQAMCADVSCFQRNTLASFRLLTEAEIIRKTQERYDIAPFNARVHSPGISIFTVRNTHGELLGSFTLNRHLAEGIEESERVGYLSDLFIREDLQNDLAFIKQFIEGVFAHMRKEEALSKVEVVTVMAGTNKDTPILRCFKYAEKAALLKLLTGNEQARLGLVVHFTWEPQKNAGRKHLPPKPKLPSLGDNLFTKFGQPAQELDVQPALNILPTLDGDSYGAQTKTD